MCVSYCARTGQLFWNHEPCSYEFCVFVIEEHGRCYSCQHRQVDICGLTRAPLPQPPGCCHWNVEPVSGRQQVTPEMLEPLGWRGEPVAELLAALDAPHEVDERGRAWVEPPALDVPAIYGWGTEEMAVDEWDWADWEAAWEEG